MGEQGWRSDESTRLPPVWLGFKSSRGRHMWVSLLMVFSFAPGTPIFLSPQKTTFPKSIHSLFIYVPTQWSLLKNQPLKEKQKEKENKKKAT